VKKKVIIGLKKRFGKIEYFSKFPIATILDARFKNVHSRDPIACQKAITVIKKLAKSCIQGISSTDCSSVNEELKQDNFDL
jgi:hypothetical protein